MISFYSFCSDQTNTENYLPSYTLQVRIQTVPAQQVQHMAAGSPKSVSTVVVTTAPSPKCTPDTPPAPQQWSHPVSLQWLIDQGCYICTRIVCFCPIFIRVLVQFANCLKNIKARNLILPWKPCCLSFLFLQVLHENSGHLLTKCYLLNLFLHIVINKIYHKKIQPVYNLSVEIPDASLWENWKVYMVSW